MASEALLSAERIEAFEQQLGIAPQERDDFGWIAEVGLQSPLPPRWTSHTDDGTGYVYYVDHDRQVSSWENPLVPYLRRVVEVGRRYLQDPYASYFDDQKGVLWHEHKCDLDCWNGPFTSEGGQYYVNAVGGLSSWQDPRIDAQYIFELESGLLTSLQEVLPPADPDTPGFGDFPPQQDGSTWRTDGGAEVLTLDGSRPGSSFQRGRSQSQVFTGLALKTARQEHKSALETLGAFADKLHDYGQDDIEVQKLQLERKVEQRRQRRLAAKAKSASRGPIWQDGRPKPPQLGAESPAPWPPEPLLPPPPPPEGATAQSTQPHSNSDDIGPPMQAPSPSNGKKPSLAPELEHRLEAALHGKNRASNVQSAFPSFELSTPADT